MMPIQIDGQALGAVTMSMAQWFTMVLWCHDCRRNARTSMLPTPGVPANMRSASSGS